MLFLQLIKCQEKLFNAKKTVVVWFYVYEKSNVALQEHLRRCQVVRRVLRHWKRSGLYIKNQLKFLVYK